jgi:hypothetical protein
MRAAILSISNNMLSCKEQIGQNNGVVELHEHALAAAFGRAQ